MTTGKGDRAGNERLGQFSLFRQDALALDEHKRDTLERRSFIAGHGQDVMHADRRNAESMCVPEQRHASQRDAARVADVSSSS
jgi:hypothetical protein